MLTKSGLRIYRKSRQNGMSAKSALDYARYQESETLWEARLYKTDTDTVRGFDVTVQIQADEYGDTSWIGEFRSSKGQGFPYVLKRHNVERGEMGFFEPTQSVASRAKDLCGLGYSRAHAYETALRYAYEDMRRLERYGSEWGFVTILVTVSKNGKELAADSLCGIESDSDQAYLDATASEMILACVGRAQETLMAEDATDEELTLA
jgi:hypothetical protein